MTVKKFTVIGERCTGTNLARVLIERNLGLEYVELCSKHYFQRADFENVSDVLIVATVRDPFQWISALWVNKHDMTIYQKHSMAKMIFGEQIAIYDDFKALDYSAEIMGNRHIYEPDTRFCSCSCAAHMNNSDMMFVCEAHKHMGRRYTNLFELRNTKHKFLLDDMPKLVPHFEIVNYEDLRDKPEEVIDKLCDKFDLHKPAEFMPVLENVKYIYGSESGIVMPNSTQNVECGAPYKKRVYEPDESLREVVQKNVDRDLESRLNYIV